MGTELPEACGFSRRLITDNRSSITSSLVLRVISHFFRTASRWIFFAALIYAPWAYGATTSSSIQITNWILLAALVLWAVELLLSGREPRFPRLLFFLTGALICIGGWMVFNAKAIYDSDFFVFVPLRNLAPPLIGSTDYAISAAS